MSTLFLRLGKKNLKANADDKRFCLVVLPGENPYDT
jgi:hypothetical protein